MKNLYFRELDLSPIQHSVVLLDIDGTLLADGDSQMDTASEAAVNKLVGQGNMVYLVSNGFSHKHERNKAIAAKLGITFYETQYKKPLKISVAPLIVKNKPALVIGDKFLTDGLLAVNLGIPYVEVRSLRGHNDPPQARLGYFIDSIAKKMIGDWARPPHYAAKLYRRTEPPVLTVLTRPPINSLTLGAIAATNAKIGLKKLLFNLTRHSAFRTNGGPQSVIESLCKGLSELHVPFRRDPWQYRTTSLVGVIAGTDTLRWALEQKNKGFIHTIVAGPNIVVTPTDENNLIKNDLIDKVVVPSEWNKKWWLTFDQLFESKAAIWAAGTDDHGTTRTAIPPTEPRTREEIMGDIRSGVCIVYSKNADEKLFNKIIETLWTYKLPIVVSTYGQFKQEDYFHLLKKARMLIYLSTHESQGIALLEAWMAGIPTLVWNRGYFMYEDKRFEDPAVGAPYLTPECGLSFENDGDFERKFIEFTEKYDSFKPRSYALAHFTNAICARKYLDILESAKTRE